MITITYVPMRRPGLGKGFWKIVKDGKLIDTALTRGRAVKLAREKYGFDPKPVSSRKELTGQKSLLRLDLE